MPAVRGGKGVPPELMEVQHPDGSLSRLYAPVARHTPYPYPALWKPLREVYVPASSATPYVTDTSATWEEKSNKWTSTADQAVDRGSSSQPSPSTGPPIVPSPPRPRPLIDRVTLTRKEDFMASYISQNIKLELAGALNATTIGIGDIYAPLLRVLVPEPYDPYGLPAARSVVPGPAVWLLTNAVLENAPKQFHSAAASTPTDVPKFDSTPVKEFIQTLSMVRAFSTLQERGTTFTCRSIWITARSSSGEPVPRATLVVAPAFNLANLYEHVPEGVAPGSNAELTELHQIVSAARAVRAREALALAALNVIMLRQTTGHGLAVAVVGSRFARVVAVSDTLVAVEMGNLLNGAAFTVVNMLSRTFDDQLYDRFPHSFSKLPDQTVESVWSRAFTSPNVHFENMLDEHALQRFLDLFAASHSAVNNSAVGPITETLLSAANNHRAPEYIYPEGTPRSDIGAVWALQMGHVVVAELPAYFFDDLLCEMVTPNVVSAELAHLPTPNTTAPSTTYIGSIPLPNHTDDPDQSPELITGYTGVAAVNSVAAYQSPLLAETALRRSSTASTASANPKAKAARTMKPKSLQEQPLSKQNQQESAQSKAQSKSKGKGKANQPTKSKENAPENPQNQQPVQLAQPGQEAQQPDQQVQPPVSQVQQATQHPQHFDAEQQTLGRPGQPTQEHSQNATQTTQPPQLPTELGQGPQLLQPLQQSAQEFVAQSAHQPPQLSTQQTSHQPSHQPAHLPAQQLVQNPPVNPPTQQVPDRQPAQPAQEPVAPAANVEKTPLQTVQPETTTENLVAEAPAPNKPKPAAKPKAKPKAKTKKAPARRKSSRANAQPAPLAAAPAHDPESEEEM